MSIMPTTEILVELVWNVEACLFLKSQQVARQLPLTKHMLIMHTTVPMIELACR